MPVSGRQMTVSISGDGICAWKMSVGARSLQRFGQMLDEHLGTVTTVRSGRLRAELVERTFRDWLIYESMMDD